MSGTKKAVATRVSGNVYTVTYPGKADMDANVGFAYLRRLVRDGYSVAVNQRGQKGDGEPDAYTMNPGDE